MSESIKNQDAFKEAISYVERMNERKSPKTNRKSTSSGDPEVSKEKLESFKLYNFPNVFKSIISLEKEKNCFSDSGLRRIKEAQNYSIPEDLLYKIDKIVWQKLKEESINFPKLDSHSLIREEENENTSTD